MCFKTIGGRYEPVKNDSGRNCPEYTVQCGLFFFVVPQAYAMMFPKGIKKAAKPYVKRKELRVMHLVLYPLYLLMFMYMALSAHLVGVRDFWDLFWTGYIEMMFSDASTLKTKD